MKINHFLVCRRFGKNINSLRPPEGAVWVRAGLCGLAADSIFIASGLLGGAAPAKAGFA